MRFILNLKALNMFIETQHFKLEDLRTVLNIISKDYFSATIDLKDAYFLIKIHPESRKYLRFILEDEYNTQMFEFNVLPFGLCTAPFIFTKLMKPIMKLLRSCGFLSSIYLDDIYLVGKSYHECQENVRITCELLKALGFIINNQKSRYIPSKRCQYLGYIVDTQMWQVSLPLEKRERIMKELQVFVRLKRCTIRRFAQLVGVLVSACPAVEYGWLYVKELERCKYLNLKGHDDYDRIMTIPDSLLPDLHWWITAINTSVHRIRNGNYALEIYSDASTTGWGAVCDGQTASGQWSPAERTLHINHLELLAAYFAIKIFTKNYNNCLVLLRVDNTTAMSYINRMGGVQFPHLNKVTRDIWQWCETRKILITASYIKSSDNVLADHESRRSHPDVEWELTDAGFKLLTETFGNPQIDLFASRLNNKCDMYASWHRDPDAFVVDAFTISWSNNYFYAFPPVAVILKALRKIISDKATGIMVVPAWPSQPWYPLFTRLVISKAITLDANHIIFPHCSSGNIQASITLVGAVLSGQHYCEETHPQPP